MRLFSVPRLSQRVLLCQKKRILSFTDTANQFYGRYIHAYVCMFEAMPFSATLRQESTYDFYSGTHKHICIAWLTHVLQKHLVFLCARTRRCNEQTRPNDMKKIKTKANTRLNTNVYSHILFRICEQFFGIEAAVYRFILQIDLSFQ